MFCMTTQGMTTHFVKTEKVRRIELFGALSLPGEWSRMNGLLIHLNSKETGSSVVPVCQGRPALFNCPNSALNILRRI